MAAIQETPEGLRTASSMAMVPLGAFFVVVIGITAGPEEGGVLLDILGRGQVFVVYKRYMKEQSRGAERFRSVESR